MAERGRARGRAQGYAGTWPEHGVTRADGFVPSGLGVGASLIAKLREWAAAEAGAGRLLPWVPRGIQRRHSPLFQCESRARRMDHRRCGGSPFGWCLSAAAAEDLSRRGDDRGDGLRICYLDLAHGVYRSWRADEDDLFGASFPASWRHATSVSAPIRFVLRVTQMDAPHWSTKLERVRLSVRKGAAPDVGSYVELKGRLQPPLASLPGPGSYNFARDMFFQGIGASGFVTGAIKIVAPPVNGGWLLRYEASMQDLRDAIDARIHTTLDGDKRAIATALLTGRRDAITTPVNDCDVHLRSRTCALDIGVSM